MTGVEESTGTKAGPCTEESPCTKVCALDGATGWCLGCGRTGPEIAAWRAMDAAGHRALKALLPARLRQIGGRALSAADQG
ncbi:MAG: hypothetical protein FD175_1133 [Beijerinckiaceae bacterium]|nr:MAG: hypothetical protein FD175_1133 [Beijerinckiaceae bacterium]